MLAADADRCLTPDGFGQQSSGISLGLVLRPSLRSVQNSQKDDLSFANFVDCNERKRREGDLSRALDAARPAEMRERLQCADALDDGLRHPSRGLRTAFCNVVADPFEIVRGIHRPADAYQPR